MRVTVLELPATWGAPEVALAAVDHALAQGPDTDLVVLPEAALTGYVSPEGVFDPAPFAEPIDGPTAARASAIAGARGVFLAAPLILREGAVVSNAIVVFDREGRRVATYRKRHPWFPEGWATAGTEAHPVVDVDGVAVTIAICFDVHFLRDEAADVLARADVLLFPSAWVDEHDTREALLVDLARDHDLAIANANWGPGVVVVPGQGGSCVVDRTGAVRARVAPGEIRADATLSAGTSRLR